LRAWSHKKKEKNKQGDIALKCRGDSFVVKTNIHFPTDINLLYDAMRKLIELTGELFESCGMTGWRQYRYSIKTIKRAFHKVQQSKKSKSKTAEAAIKKAHQDYIELSEVFLRKVTSTLSLPKDNSKLSFVSIGHIAKTEVIHHYIRHAERQINQIDRRVLKGEVIPHAEKVFSIFQPHTEWINKGKAGVLVELGIRVGIIEDQYQFLLHHRVMQKETDEKVAVIMMQEAKGKFPGMNAISYDRGYYSGKNREKLNEELANVALPKKGKLSNKDKEIQNSTSYKYAKQKHPAIESAINALDVHGLDKCLDHGIQGFERYVAIAIISRNIQRIGAIIHQRDRKLFEKRERRKRKRLKAA